MLKNLGAILKAAGSGFDLVVKTTVYLVDMADFSAMNEVYAKYFPTHKPARSTIQAAALPKAVRVEIDAIAVDSSDPRDRIDLHAHRLRQRRGLYGGASRTVPTERV